MKKLWYVTYLLLMEKWLHMQRRQFFQKYFHLMCPSGYTPKENTQVPVEQILPFWNKSFLIQKGFTCRKEYGTSQNYLCLLNKLISHSHL